MDHQTARYGGDFYRNFRQIRWLVRFDVRYRCRRMREVARELNVDLENREVLDVGFGAGHMLASFPKSCHLYGAEISASAVEMLSKADSPLKDHRAVDLFQVDPNDPESMPQGPFDVVLSSHTIEHVPSDRALLRSIHARLRPDGLFFLFLPIEEPNYHPDHVRSYSMESIRALMEEHGFNVLYEEGSFRFNGMYWKTLTIPSRRRMPVIGKMTDALRLCHHSLFPYSVLKAYDKALEKLGVGPRQGLLIAKRA